MRHLAVFGALAACAFTLAACGPPPDPVAHAEVCNQEDGKVVQTTGYFAVDGSVFCSNIGSSEVDCGFDFVAAPGDETGFSADVAEGTGRNQVEPIPDDFTPEAIVFHDADGAEVRIGDKVTITGKVLIAENVCLVNVETIAKAP